MKEFHGEQKIAFFMPDVFLGRAGVLPKKLLSVFHYDGCCNSRDIYGSSSYSIIKIVFLCAGSIFGGMLMCL